eukprot:gene9300-9465_t
MRALFTHLVIAVVCASVGAMAARFPSMPSMFEIPESAVLASPSGASSMKQPAPHNSILPTSYADNLEALLLMHPEVADHEHGPIRISTKFIMHPSGHKEFIEEWMQFEKKSSDIKGVAHISLNKIVGDNIVFTSYAVYEDWQAIMDHMHSEALHDFGGYVMEANVVIEVHLLFKIGGCHKNAVTCVEEAPAAGQQAHDDGGEAGKKDKHPVRLLTLFVVEPGTHQDFVEAWEDMEEDLSKAKGNLALALHKPMGDNILFVGYSAWESPEAFWDGVRGDAAKDFIKYIEDRRVVAINKKLWHVGEKSN